MGETRPEPPRPPAYEAVHAAHHRLAEAERQLRWRRAVDTAIEVEEQQLGALWLQLDQERAEVEALESPTLRSIRARFRRSHDADLATEQADVQAVEAEIAARLDAIDAIDASPGQSTVDGAIEAVEQARTDLGDAMAWWRAEHLAANTPLGVRLVDLDRLATYLHSLRRESHEALDVSRLTIAALITARRLLSQRTLPVLVGRSERARLEAIAKVQRWLLELRAELSDLGRLEPPEVDGPELTLPSLHIGPGDILDDWIVDNRVLATTVSVDASLARVHRVAAGLGELATQLDTQIDALDQESWDLLLEHPGTV